MSNHQLATMILKMFMNDLDRVVGVGSRGSESFKSNRSEDDGSISVGSEDDGSISVGSEDDGSISVGSVDDNNYILPDVKGIDYDIQCEKGEDLGELIGGSELSKISITQENDQIGFIFNGSEPILWDNGDDLDSGNYGEVKKFTFDDPMGGDVKSVAIKKINYYKVNERKIINEEGEKVKVPLLNEDGTIVKKIIKDHLNEVKLINRIMNICDKDREKCIFECGIIPVSVIKDNSGNFTFGRGDNEHGYIALELMDGTLSDYYNKKGKNLSKMDNKQILDDMKNVLITTAKALKCFSDRGWYYPDFKPSNIMYRCDNNKITIRIIDVGSLVSEEDMEKEEGYILSYRDIDGSENKWMLYNETNSNFKYLHVYLMGVLLIRILQRSFKIKIKDYRDFGEYLDVIEKDKNKRIKEDHIKKMINELRVILKESFDGFEKYVLDIYELFNRTILSQYDDNCSDDRKVCKARGDFVKDPRKKRFRDEQELIDYLENMFK